MNCLKPNLYISGEATEVTAQENIFNLEGALSRILPKRSLKASVHPSDTKSSFIGAPVRSDSKLFLLLLCHPGFWFESQSESVCWLFLISIEEGVLWKTYNFSALSPKWGTHCTAVAPVPITAIFLSFRRDKFPNELPPVYS